MPIDTHLTYDDYCSLPNDGKRYEIIDGELFVTPTPPTKHQLVVMNLVYHVAEFVKKHDLGVLYVGPLDVVFSQYDVVEPDILYVSKARAAIVTEKKRPGRSGPRSGSALRVDREN